MIELGHENAPEATWSAAPAPASRCRRERKTEWDSITLAHASLNWISRYLHRRGDAAYVSQQLQKTLSTQTGVKAVRQFCGSD
jgi:hypothetical protein